MQSKELMQSFVVNLLNSNLPKYCYYHSVAHTLYVLEQVQHIGKQENCTKMEITLLSAAAVWHDTGYIHTTTGHEEASCILAGKYLPQYGFSETEINAIIGMIRATKIPQVPKTNLEAIIADADLIYLGTKEASTIAALLFKELKTLKPTLTPEVWNKAQLDFLYSHQFFTNYCKIKHEPIKQLYIKSLEVQFK